MEHTGIRPAQVAGGGGALRAIGALVLREMSTSYGRSPGGYIWAVLEPTAGIALLSVIFALGFRAPPLGDNFALFYATGVVPFVMFTDISGKLGTAIMFSRQLLSYPAVSILDAILARFFLGALTQVMVACLIFGGLFAVFDAPPPPRPERIALGLFLALALALGVGTFNCFLMSMFPLWQRIWSILTRPLFLISCLFFTFESVPDAAQGAVWWVPTAHLPGLLREGIYPGFEADHVSPLYICALSAGLFAGGVLFLRRYHRVILNA